MPGILARRLSESPICKVWEACLPPLLACLGSLEHR